MVEISLCSYIYEINKRRNEELKKELKFIESILQEENIKFLFFKGSALIIDEIYDSPW